MYKTPFCKSMESHISFDTDSLSGLDVQTTNHIVQSENIGNF